MADSNSADAERYFSTVFAVSPDMISVSLWESGTYLQVNEAFLELTGYKIEEVIGKTSNELGLWAEDDGRFRFQSLLVDQRRVRGLNVLLRIKSGEKRNFQLSAAVVTIGNQDCIVTISRDTTDRDALVEGLEKSRFLLERAEEMSNIGSWELDYQTGKVYASPGASRIYGFDPDQFTVKSTEKVPLEEYRSALDEARDRLVKEGLPYDIEFKIRRQTDGQIREIHSKAQWDKSNRRMFGIIRDVTVEKAAEEKIKGFNRELENLVASRTEELQKTNTLLSSALDDIKKAQKELVLSEKLAAIGQLSAGLAHEINTPLGAIVSAETTITRFLGTLLPQTIAFLADLPLDQRRHYAALVQIVTKERKSLALGNGSPRRKQIAEKLKPFGLTEVDQISDLLFDLDLDSIPEQYPEFFQESHCGVILERIWEIYSAWKMANVVEMAAHKAAKVVSALRLYLGSQTPDDFEVVDVEKDLEVSLTLLHNKVKGGITVVKNFSGVQLVGSAHELSQVWINLINNAIQAMDYKGTLTISTETSTQGTTVRISDTGPGIPESIRDRIFEPFFTTKKPGEGIGIGLDICRKIVERNRGQIEFESCPGRTTFIVRLPAAGKA